MFVQRRHGEPRPCKIRGRNPTTTNHDGNNGIVNKIMIPIIITIKIISNSNVNNDK